MVRTCQVLDQSLHVPLLALKVLGQSWGESWRYVAKDWNNFLQSNFRTCGPKRTKLTVGGSRHALTMSGHFLLAYIRDPV